MPDEITPDVFSHLVDLAALELTPQEAEYMRGQLNNQLRAIQQLAETPIPEDTAPAAHGVPYTAQTRQPLREDQWLPFADAIDIIGQVPQVEDGFVVVPDIPHTTLE